MRAASSSGSWKHRAWVDSPMPRGSQLTMSKDWRTAEGNWPYHCGNWRLPVPPGPPGLKKSVPTGLPPCAGMRRRASLTVGPASCR